MDVVSVLEQARGLIAEPACWTKGSSARDKFGGTVMPTSPQARCFCANGAVDRASGGFRGHTGRRALELLDDQTGCGNIVRFNDFLDTEHADVLEVFDRAIMAARAA